MVQRSCDSDWQCVPLRANHGTIASGGDWGRGFDMISVCICISEHTVKIIVQGMRKTSSSQSNTLVPLRKETAGLKNPKRLQPSREQVWLTMD